jgi:hypothetical protein
MAGVLSAYAQHNVIPDSYQVLFSIIIFLAVVIGGITSVPFAVLGAVILEAFVLFGHRLDPLLGAHIASILPLLLTGPLLILNLYFYPGGTAENGFAQRDKFLRWVAAKHDILVPSLVADRRVEEEQEQSSDIISRAGEHVQEVESFDVVGATVTCPVCGDTLPLEEAAEHEHLQAKVAVK